MSIRIGVNGGSLERELWEKYGGPTAEAMVESARRHIQLLEQEHFYDYVLSLKHSNVKTMLDAYRMAAEVFDCPLHLGVTEAGTARMGLVKSAIGIGSLLADGIGDTIRVSLTADPVTEIAAAGISSRPRAGEHRASQWCPVPPADVPGSTSQSGGAGGSCPGD